MKKIIPVVFLLITINIGAQKPGYYNGTEELKGAALKVVLHDLIDDHVSFSYSNTKYVLNYAQEVPGSADSLIQFYTNRIVSNDTWATGGDNLNREHIWAQSHGDLDLVFQMDGDAHNLHAADASVNVTRSNYDFDNVSSGTYIEEADAYYVSGSFEPSDRDKGAVARTLMYMAVRYEGDNDEIDLELADYTGTYPNALHGKLSTLLEWNRDFPPTDWERRRNDRIEQCQCNRNPFIDHPEFADLIWADSAVNDYTVSDLALSSIYPKPNEAITLTLSANGVDALKLLWGTEYNNVANEVSFADNGNGEYSASFTPSGTSGGDFVYCRVVAIIGSKTDTIFNSFMLEPQDALVSISDIQGTGDATTMENQTVAVAGVVTANLETMFTLQSGSGQRKGITVYSYLRYDMGFRGHIGDSVKVVGTVTEYNGLTEISDVTMLYNYGQVGEVEPDTISISEIGEDYEGGVVVLKNVSFDDGGSYISVGKTYAITDGSNSINLYSEYNGRIAGGTFPSGSVNVKAVVSEYYALQLLANDVSWLDVPTATSTAIENIIAENENTVLLYPVPASSGVLNIESKQMMQSIKIYNILGQLLWSDNGVNSYSEILNIDFLSVGNYVLELCYADSEITKLFVVSE